MSDAPETHSAAPNPDERILADFFHELEQRADDDVDLDACFRRQPQPPSPAHSVCR